MTAERERERESIFAGDEGNVRSVSEGRDSVAQSLEHEIREALIRMRILGLNPRPTCKVSDYPRFEDGKTQ